MLRRFFRKTVVEDGRSHVRRVPGRGDALGVKVVCANGAAITGVLGDLSAGGAAIEFDQDMSGDLAPGEVREIVFCSLAASPISVVATVRSVPAAGGPHRFGFEFLDQAALFEKLDEDTKNSDPEVLEQQQALRKRWDATEPASAQAVNAQAAIEAMEDVQRLEEELYACADELRAVDSNTSRDRPSSPIVSIR